MQFDWNEALAILKPLGIFVAGMVVYAVFIFKFYRFLGRRDIIKADFDKYNTARHPVLEKIIDGLFYFIKYLFLLPVCVLFWGMVLTGLLAFLSKANDAGQIMLIAMALIASIRVASYYDEDLSKDLAKMLPFALLGVYLVDVSFFNLEASISVLKQLPGHVTTLLYYFMGVMALEIVLRILSAFFPRRSTAE